MRSGAANKYISSVGVTRHARQKCLFARWVDRISREFSSCQQLCSTFSLPIQLLREEHRERTCFGVNSFLP